MFNSCLNVQVMLRYNLLMIKKEKLYFKICIFSLEVFFVAYVVIRTDSRSTRSLKCDRNSVIYYLKLHGSMAISEIDFFLI